MSPDWYEVRVLRRVDSREVWSAERIAPERLVGRLIALEAEPGILLEVHAEARPAYRQAAIR